MSMISIISSIKSIATTPFSFKSPKRKEDLPCDIFEKRIESVAWDEKKLQEIYDKTYTEVMRQHKIIFLEFDKLKLTKPKIILKSLDSESAASYTFSDNTINFDPIHLKDDYYSVDILDEKGKIKQHIATLCATHLENSKELIKENYGDFKTTKLTNKEKEAYISACLAHEIRHFMQNHIIASTTGASKAQKEEYEKLYKEIKSTLSSLSKEERKALGKFDVKKVFGYVKKYRPKKQLDENTTLKYSIFQEDDRYWSVKNHLLMSEIARLKSDEESSINENYLASCTEVDAYRYEYEFFLSQIGKFGDDFREDILCAIAAELEFNANDTLNEMLKKGVNFEHK